MNVSYDRNRNYAFDFARAIAIILIVSCHFLLFNGFDGMSPVGRGVANIGNFIFFALSAILFGLRFESSGKQAFSPMAFMTKRLVRLFASLWPFLALLIPIYFLLGEHLSFVKIFLNFMGLGWLGKLPNNGHLWFVTMIIMCYVMFVIVANIFMSPKSRGGVILPLIICALLEFAIDTRGLPGYLFMVLGYSFCLFKYAAKYLMFVKKQMPLLFGFRFPYQPWLPLRHVSWQSLSIRFLFSTLLVMQPDLLG